MTPYRSSEWTVFAAWMIFTVAAAATGRADVLVSNYNSGTVLRYSDGGTFLGTVVTAGSGGLDRPHRARIGPDGLLYVASAETDEILRYNATTGTFVDAFIGAGSGGLDYPVDFVFHTDGYFYVSSQLGDEILRYDAVTGVHDAGYAAAAPALDGPSGIVFDAGGNLYTAGRYSGDSVRFDASGVFEQVVGAGNFGVALRSDGALLSAAGDEIVLTLNPATSPDPSALVDGGLSIPIGVEIGPDGDLYAADYGTSQLLRFDAETGAFIDVFLAGGDLNGPNYFTFVIPEPSVGVLFGLAVGLAMLRRSMRK